MFRGLEVSSKFGSDDPTAVTRAELAMALAILLFEDVVDRVPMARAYVNEAARNGRKLCFDHGALRTVAATCGDLPNGSLAISRVLKPLGYTRTETYDLSRLGMTGYSWTHTEFAAAIPQYFVSELHPERFSSEFQAATKRVFGNSKDPLPASAMASLGELSRDGRIGLQAACALLPELTGCFTRHHEEPTLADYEMLLAESSEMAWIATEGHAFNHATDRVADVVAVAAGQRALNRPVKDEVEVSATGRVLQTAFRAAMVDRLFVDADGHLVQRSVPGSFHEFITRRLLPNGKLDLSFDPGNAQSIFRMTAATEPGA